MIAPINSDGETVTWEYMSEYGFLAETIMEQVATIDELVDLAKKRLSVERLIESKYPWDLEDYVHTLMRTWNDRIGEKVFFV